MAENKLIDEAMKAYGIDREYVIGSRYDAETKQAVIVTAGGAKVRFAAGDDVDPLDPVRVTGMTDKPPRKPIAGKARAKKAEDADDTPPADTETKK